MGNVIPIAKIHLYTIYRDGKAVQNKILGWRSALAQARKWSRNLFNEPKKVEILNVWTGEIISLEEAEIKAAEWLKKRKMRVNSGTRN